MYLFNFKRFGKYHGIWVVVLQDCFLSVLSSLFALLIIRWISDPIHDFTSIVFKWLLYSLIATLLGFIITGCYKVVRRFTTSRSSLRLFGSIIIKELLLTLVLIFSLIEMPSLVYCVLLLLLDMIFMSIALIYVRIAISMLSVKDDTIVERVSRKNVLVAGIGKSSLKMMEDLETTGDYNVIGFTTTDRNLAGRVIYDRQVFYCSTASDMDELQWRLGGVDGLFYPRGYRGSEDSGENGSEKKSNDESQSTHQATRYDPPAFQKDGMNAVERFVKRGFDLSLSALLLLIFSPLLLICLVAVKLEDGGNPIYKQERIGKGGRPFYIYKLRSMRMDAEKSGAQLAAGEGDSRLTKVGRFLRAHHLDELPQLWNVFMGDMSFIGYRPEREFYIGQISARDPRYYYLYQIRPGVTSYATLYNGYTDTIEKMLTRLDLDLYYLRNRSMWFDMKVLALTFLSIITGKKF